MLKRKFEGQDDDSTPPAKKSKTHHDNHNPVFAPEFEEVVSEDEPDYLSEEEVDSDNDSDAENHSDSDEDSASERSDSDDEYDPLRFGSSDSENEDDDRNNHDGWDEQSEEEVEFDPDNPDYNVEEPNFDEEYVLNWIRNAGDDDSEYPELDCQEIVDRTSLEDLKNVVQELLSSNMEEFDTIKELVELGNIQIDQSVLNECLDQAIKDDEADQVTFFVEQGADVDGGIETAIDEDSDSMLELLDADASEEFVNHAAEEHRLNAVRYFLGQDFEFSSLLILSCAAKTSTEEAEELTQEVCEHAELENTPDLIEHLIKENGEELIPVFIEHFGAEELLMEMNEQSGEKNLFQYVLNQAREVLSTDQIHDLAISLQNKLKISESFLVYSKDFKGHAALKKLRENFDSDISLSEEVRSATNFIGNTFSTARRYFTHSPYHTPELEDAEKYFRSAKHILTTIFGKSRTQYEFKRHLPEAKAEMGLGGQAHMGGYRTPQDASNLFFEIKSHAAEKKQESSGGDSVLYNELLNYRQKICKYVVTQIKEEKNDAIKTGFYHHYPCLMIYIKKPSFALSVTDAATEAWTKLVIGYYVSLVNFFAQQQGLDIELVKRSSFGFLTPTISPCGQSFRINVGIVPKEYADVLVSCLKILNESLKIINDKSLHTSIDTRLPDGCFTTTPEYQLYAKKEEDKRDIPRIRNIFEFMWAKTELGGKTTSFNLARTVFARHGLSARLYRELQQTKPKTYTDYANLFASALRWGVGNMKLIKEGKKHTLSFIQKTEDQPRFHQVSLNHKKIADDEFFSVINLMQTRIKHEQLRDQLPSFLETSEKETNGAIEKCIQERTIDNLYYSLELQQELLYTRTIYTYPGADEDAFGSDSEVEDEATENKSAVYGRKLVVQNGMRAVLGSLHAGSNYLIPDYLTSEKYQSVFLHGAYYETADAMDLLSKFIIQRKLSKINEAKILIYDINACATGGIPFPELTRQHLSKIEVLIIDSTSATTEQCHHWIEEFRRQPQMKVLFFAESGFKHQQMGADKNPYGIIRVFTKEKKLLYSLDDFFVETEEPIASGIPQHNRRMMKRAGSTPRNETILKAQHHEQKEVKSVPPTATLPVIVKAGMFCESGMATKNLDPASAVLTATEKKEKTSNSFFTEKKITAAQASDKRPEAKRHGH